MLVSLSKRHEMSPTLLAFTPDRRVLDLLLRNCLAIWRVEIRNNFVSYLNRVGNKQCGVVVLDDEKVLRPERGWSLNKIQQLMPQAFIIYIAAQHSPEVEKTARARGAGLYLSKPVDGLRLKLLLDRLGELQTKGNELLASTTKFLLWSPTRPSPVGLASLAHDGQRAPIYPA